MNLPLPPVAHRKPARPLIAAQLNAQLSTVLRRVLASIEPKISGVHVHTLAAVPGPAHAWDPDDQETDPPPNPR